MVKRCTIYTKSHEIKKKTCAKISFMIHSTTTQELQFYFPFNFCATMWILGKQQQPYTAFRFRLQGVDFSYTHSTAYCSSHKYLYNKNVLYVCFRT